MSHYPEAATMCAAGTPRGPDRLRLILQSFVLFYAKEGAYQTHIADSAARKTPSVSRSLCVPI